MKKKLRKFSEGGYSTVDSENPVPSIDEDTRSRAMKFVEDASEESRDLGAPVTRAASKSTSSVSKTVAPPTKSTVDADAEKTRMEGLLKKQALERVEPENFTPAGLLKGVLKKVVSMGAKRAEKAAAESAAKNVTRRAEEGLSPSESLAAKTPIRTRTVNGKEIPIRQGKPNLGGSTENMGVREVTNKSGKKIPVKRPGMADDGGSGAFKQGGKVSKTDMQKAGFYDKGKTKSERQKIISKVTTKPQRIAIVEKAFSTKNMKAGGMASRRADGCAIRGKTRA